MTTTTLTTTETWVTRIRSEMMTSIEAIIKVGSTLIECKESVEHGQFGAILDEAGLKPRTAQMFMAVARNPVISNAHTHSHLPPAFHSLYMLSRLEEDRLQAGLDAGIVEPTMTLNDIKTVVRRERTGVPIIPNPEIDNTPHWGINEEASRPPETCEPPEPIKWLIEDSGEWSGAPAGSNFDCDTCDSYFETAPAEEGEAGWTCPECGPDFEARYLPDVITEALESWVLDLEISTETAIPLDGLIKVPIPDRRKAIETLDKVLATVQQMVGLLDCDEVG